MKKNSKRLYILGIYLLLSLIANKFKLRSEVNLMLMYINIIYFLILNNNWINKLINSYILKKIYIYITIISYLVLILGVMKNII